MPIFNATIVNHTTPAVSVVVQDSGTSGGTNTAGVTYAQFKQSLGNQVYDVQGFYLYSTSAAQLIGVINYQRFDVSGNQNITNIVTTVDPYQFSGSIVVDLTNTPTPIILNGNSSVSTTILPQTDLQIKFLSKRITNSFGMNLYNFKEMERITNKTKFYNYGSSIESIQQSNKEIEKTASSNFLNADGDGGKNESSNNINLYETNDTIPIALLGLAAASLGYYLIKNK